MVFSFLLSPCFMHPDLFSSSGHVYWGHVAEKALSCFYGAPPLQPPGLCWHSCPGSTCWHLCFCPATPTPAPKTAPCWALVGTLCLWLCRMSKQDPLFHMTAKQGADNDWKKEIISISPKIKFSFKTSGILGKPHAPQRKSLRNSLSPTAKLTSEWVSAGALAGLETGCVTTLTVGSSGITF